ncbi:MAG: hypothetical protein MHM6MM_002028 [Cercozoa sp. M6MM]
MQQNELWFVAVPNEKSSAAAKQAELAQCVQQHAHAECVPIEVPQLRVGTQDALMQLSDELGKVDSTADSVAKKIARSYYETIGDTDTELRETAPTLMVQGQTQEQFVRQFRWQRQRFPTQMPLPALAAQLQQSTQQCMESFRSLQQRYLELRSEVAALERRHNGSLQVRSLYTVVRRSDIVEGEYLTTFVVVVPLQREKDFLANYESLETQTIEKRRREGQELPTLPPQIVCPGSALELARDEESVLFRVVLLKKGADVVRAAFREERYHVRNFTFDPAEAEKESTELETQTDNLQPPPPRVDLVRVFVESVLRFGLPVNFSVALIDPGKYPQRVRKSLQEHFGYLDGGLGDDDASGAALDYYPYVSFSLRLEKHQ